MRIYILLISLFFLACSKNPVPKPEQLLDEKTMENILFDIAVLQATETYMSDKLLENGINTNVFIYEKYSIDSLTYHQNKLYYAANPKKYKKMHKNIADRISFLKTESDSLAIKEKVETPKKPNIKKEILQKSINQE